MVEQLINECKEILKENLVSIIEFGTEGEPNNILIVTKKLSFNDLEKIKPIILKYSKRTKVVPILFTELGLMESSDVFPLELLDMKHPHEVLFGDDVIEKVPLDKKYVRRQLEYELRSKLIHLRENYIWIKKPKELKSLLKSAVPTLMPLFYGLLYLKNQKPSTNLGSLFNQVEKAYKVDMNLFRDIKGDKIKDEKLSLIVKDLMILLEKLISIVDKSNV